MATRKQNTVKREPVPGHTARRSGAEPRDVEVEDLEIEREDDASDFFEESDEYPGDRRRDPLRKP